MADDRRAGLTAAQGRFVEEYLVDLNGTRAYRVAFPAAARDSARASAARLLRSPAVRRAVGRGRAAQARRTRVTADRVLREVAAVAFSDIGELFDNDGRAVPLPDVPPAARRAVASHVGTRVTGPDGSVTETAQVRLWDKMQALGLLARHLGIDEPMPPLERLLAALPPEARDAVRAGLLAGHRSLL